MNSSSYELRKNSLSSSSPTNSLGLVSNGKLSERCSRLKNSAQQFLSHRIISRRHLMRQLSKNRSINNIPDIGGEGSSSIIQPENSNHSFQNFRLFSEAVSFSSRGSLTTSEHKGDRRLVQQQPLFFNGSMKTVADGDDNTSALVHVQHADGSISSTRGGIGGGNHEDNNSRIHRRKCFCRTLRGCLPSKKVQDRRRRNGNGTNSRKGGDEDIDGEERALVCWCHQLFFRRIPSKQHSSDQGEQQHETTEVTVKREVVRRNRRSVSGINGGERAAAGGMRLIGGHETERPPNSGCLEEVTTTVMTTTTTTTKTTFKTTATKMSRQPSNASTTATVSTIPDEPTAGQTNQDKPKQLSSAASSGYCDQVSTLSSASSTYSTCSVPSDPEDPSIDSAISLSEFSPLPSSKYFLPAEVEGATTPEEPTTPSPSSPTLVVVNESHQPEEQRTPKLSNEKKDKKLAENKPSTRRHGDKRIRELQQTPSSSSASSNRRRASTAKASSQPAPHKHKGTKQRQERKRYTQPTEPKPSSSSSSRAVDSRSSQKQLFLKPTTEATTSAAPAAASAASGSISFTSSLQSSIRRRFNQGKSTWHASRLIAGRRKQQEWSSDGGTQSTSAQLTNKSKNGHDDSTSGQQVSYTNKILLLGASESGKSTIVKQMKILFLNGFTDKERLEKVNHIRQNLADSIRSILKAMDELGQMPLANPRLASSKQYVLQQTAARSSSTSDTDCTQAFYDKVKELWQDDGVQACFHRSNEYQLMDCAKYFLGRLDSIRRPDYLPTEQDILRCRVLTTGIFETKFRTGKVGFHMFDLAGQRDERRKWIQCFNHVTGIIFVCASSSYDMVLMEDPTMNRLRESLHLFKSIWNNRWLKAISVILFLNKQDLLAEKIRDGRHKLEDYFPEYSYYVIPKDAQFDATEDKEVVRAKYFIRAQFLKLAAGSNNNNNHDCYPHFTTAVDSNNVKRVFQTCNQIIHQIHLKQNSQLL